MRLPMESLQNGTLQRSGHETLLYTPIQYVMCVAYHCYCGVVKLDFDNIFVQPEALRSGDIGRFLAAPLHRVFGFVFTYTQASVALVIVLLVSLSHSLSLSLSLSGAVSTAAVNRA